MYNGDCLTPDGVKMFDEGGEMASIDSCRAQPARWGATYGEDGGEGCTDALSTNKTFCLKSYLDPPPGYVNGLVWCAFS